MNLYQYAFRNPINYVDPSGLISRQEAIGEPPVYALDFEGTVEKYAMNAESYRRILAQYGVIVERDYGYAHVWNQGSLTEFSFQLHELYCGQEWTAGAWKLRDLDLLLESVRTIASVMYMENGSGATGMRLFQSSIGTVNVVNGEAIWSLRSNYLGILDTVTLEPGDLSREEWARFVIFHEFGHVWNGRSNGRLAREMREAVGYGVGSRCSLDGRGC